MASHGHYRWLPLCSCGKWTGYWRNQPVPTKCDHCGRSTQSGAEGKGKGSKTVKSFMREVAEPKQQIPPKPDTADTVDPNAELQSLRAALKLSSDPELRARMEAQIEELESKKQASLPLHEQIANLTNLCARQKTHMDRVMAKHDASIVAAENQLQQLREKKEKERRNFVTSLTLFEGKLMKSQSALNESTQMELYCMKSFIEQIGALDVLAEAVDEFANIRAYVQKVELPAAPATPPQQEAKAAPVDGADADLSMEATDPALALELKDALSGSGGSALAPPSPAQLLCSHAPISPTQPLAEDGYARVVGDDKSKTPFRVAKGADPQY